MITLLEGVLEKIRHSTRISIVIVVAEGCHERQGRLHSEIDRVVNERALPVDVHVVCYTSIETLFPRPLTQVVYFFSPATDIPILVRTAYNPAEDLVRDISIVSNVMQGSTLSEAIAEYPELEEYKAVDAMLQTERDIEFPTPFQMARNFAIEMWNSTKERLHGRPVLVDASIASQRLTICHSCPLFVRDRCSKCGCVMTAKVHLKLSKCPDGKW